MPPVAYQIEFAPAAERQLSKLPREDQSRLIAAIELLETEPRPAGSKKLKGETNT
jgi:mRNA interferase RelE/StbE